MSVARVKKIRENFQVQVEVRTLSRQTVVLGPFVHFDTMVELQEAIKESL